MPINLDTQTFDLEDSHPPLIGQLATHLQARRYSRRTIPLYLTSARHFLFWLNQQISNNATVNPGSVQEFIDNHLPVCHCLGSAPKSVNTVRAALNQLLLMLGHSRICASAKLASAETEASLRQFNAYLQDVCGLTTGTCHARCRYIRGFLDDLFHNKPLVFNRIDAESLIVYINDQARFYPPATLGALACALRSYLRFLQFSGEITAAISTTIPAPANWRLASLPPSLSEDELNRFWDAFDCSTAMGKRDYAMARCLTDLALRCHEVAELHLDAIDWHAGVLHLERTKSRRVNMLPLPQITGQALIDYLRQGRPTSSSPTIFVYHRAPRGEGIQKTTVRGATRRAFARAGLDYSGTHILRHTAATKMLQGGATLKAIADVLGHCSIDTTLIYSKVDLPQLSQVALPWPGQPS